MANPYHDLPGGVDCSELRGHFLTRREAAVAAGMPASKLKTLAGVVRVEGAYAGEEVYPDFQFRPEGGFVPGIRQVVALVEGSLHGADLAGWLLASRIELGGRSVVEWLAAGGAAETARRLASGVTTAAA